MPNPIKNSFFGKRKPEAERSKPEKTAAFFGFILMGVTILSLLILIGQQEFGRSGDFIETELPVLFFLCMLGYVLINPDLLKDQNNSLSTLRIVVFMMTNVICMLMLKVGWAQDSFDKMGINANWVTIIGLLFGAKVAQSYVENHPSAAVSTLMTNTAPDEPAPVVTSDSVTAEIAKLAADQNRASLRDKFSNINSVSDTISYDESGKAAYVVALYLSDDDAAHIPDTLDADVPGQGVVSVATDIITGVGTPVLQNLQDMPISGAAKREIGSIGAMVSSDDIDGFRGVLTSGHIQSNGTSFSLGHICAGTERADVLINGGKVAEWHFQLISTVQDLAIAQLDDTYAVDDYISFNDYYHLSSGDIKQTQVNLESKISGSRIGFIIDYNFPVDMPYNDGKHVAFTNVILIGNSKNPDNSKPVSQDGDSGGAVYVNSDGQNKLVGLILGRDLKFTYVLPVQDTLNAWNFKLK